MATPMRTPAAAPPRMSRVMLSGVMGRPPVMVSMPFSSRSAMVSTSANGLLSVVMSSLLSVAFEQFEGGFEVGLVNVGSAAAAACEGADGAEFGPSEDGGFRAGDGV